MPAKDMINLVSKEVLTLKIVLENLLVTRLSKSAHI